MKSKNTLARLLSSKNEFSVLEEEQVLEQVLQNTPSTATARKSRPTTPLPWLRVLAWTSPVLLVGIFFALAPAILKNSGQDQFTSKGTNTKPTFAVSCLEKPKPDVCYPGDKMGFRIVPPKELRFFAAFSRNKVGDIIWYFPGLEPEKSLDTSQRDANGVLASGVLVDERHQPGSYEVYGLFSREPLDRTRIRRLIDDEVCQFQKECILLVRTFEVREKE